MRIKPSTDIARILKEKWERSNSKEEWRVLTGRNPKGRYDMFVSSPERLWQLKIELTGDNEAMSFGLEAGKMDEEIKRLMKTGSPVPFGLISPQKKPDLAIIMAGIQQYSSDSAYQLSRECISDKQVELDERLDREIEEMRKNPLLRRKYDTHKEKEQRLYV
jgi:hypothetical protein